MIIYRDMNGNVIERENMFGIENVMIELDNMEEYFELENKEDNIDGIN